MSVEYNFKPIVNWPRKRTMSRKRAPFKVGYGRCLIDMERELAHLRARSVVIQADTTEDHIRQDGRLRSNAVMRGPGIILSFDSKHGPLSYACDTYTHWQDNLRAIVLTLIALRAVDRYGCTTHAEQYKGWKALPGGTGESRGVVEVGEWANKEQAAAWMIVQTDDIEVPLHRVTVDPEVRARVYKAAARKCHPDHAGGDGSLMAKLNRCKEYLDS